PRLGIEGNDDVERPLAEAVERRRLAHFHPRGAGFGQPLGVAGAQLQDGRALKEVLKVKVCAETTMPRLQHAARNLARLYRRKTMRRMIKCGGCRRTAATSSSSTKRVTSMSTPEPSASSRRIRAAIASSLPRASS